MEQLIHQRCWIKDVPPYEFQNVSTTHGKSSSPAQLPFCSRVMSRGRGALRFYEFSKDIWGHSGPEFILASTAESLITSKIYGQSGGEKYTSQQIYNLILFFLITLGMTSYDRILEWMQGNLETQWEVLYFGVWSISYLQRSGRKEPGKWARETVREWVSAGLILCVNSEN